MAYKSKFFDVRQAWVEKLDSGAREAVMSRTAHEHIRVMMETGVRPENLHTDAWIAREGFDRAHPMYQWYDIAVREALKAVENATGPAPETKPAKALNASAEPFAPRASETENSALAEFEKRCQDASIRITKE